MNSGIVRALLMMFVVPAILTGCAGYRAGFLIPADIHSVHIKMPENETFWREGAKSDNLDPAMAAAVIRPAQTIEVDLAERLKNEILRRTPLRLKDESVADSILETTITGFEPSVLLRDSEDEVISQRVNITVNFRWIERRTGRVLATGQGVSRPTDFNVARGETLTTAERKSLEHVAIQIVEQLREGF